ncbi:MAG: zf-HC2 domain-containing protein [Candidatus Aminicenantes bacterium]|nr:zf-HC2 domain-containing protein [Candidatus Aminicenantes bacterium]
MECIQVEDLISGYIENELPRELHKEVSLHLEACQNCRLLKEKVEELVYAFPELEEDVPFFVKNRLYYIPESQDNIIELEGERLYLKWIAAMVGTFVLFLNLFYFTNVFPPANRTLHLMVSGIKTLTVKTEAIYEKVKESNKLFFLSSKNGETEPNGNEGEDKKTRNSAGKNIEKNGGKNG